MGSTPSGAGEYDSDGAPGRVQAYFLDGFQRYVQLGAGQRQEQPVRAQAERRRAAGEKDGRRGTG
ncbi:hypothetical protein ACWEFL_26680 [Streptomyces sp. NPDC004838]